MDLQRPTAGRVGFCPAYGARAPERLDRDRRPQCPESVLRAGRLRLGRLIYKCGARNPFWQRICRSPPPPLAPVVLAAALAVYQPPLALPSRVTLLAMTSCDLARDQAPRVRDALGPMRVSLHRVRKRMGQLGFDPNDRLFQLVQRSDEDLQAFWIELHNLSCGTGMGRE